MAKGKPGGKPYSGVGKAKRSTIGREAENAENMAQHLRREILGENLHDFGMGSAGRIEDRINDRRERDAYRGALAAGLPEDEARERGRNARITRKCFLADMRIILDRVRKGANAGAALFLDDQISQVQSEIEASYALDEMILAEGEKARDVQWVHDRSEVVPGRTARSRSTLKVVESTTRRAKVPGSAPVRADYFTRLQANFVIRARLRDEWRRLRIGIDVLAQQGLEPEADRGFASLLTRLSDPQEAQEACAELYAREMQEIAEARETVLPEHLGKIVRGKLDRQYRRCVMLRDFIKAPKAIGEGEHKSFEIIFEEVRRPEEPGPEGATIELEPVKQPKGRPPSKTGKRKPWPRTRPRVSPTKGLTKAVREERRKAKEEAGVKP